MNKGTISRLVLVILLVQAGIALAKYSGGDGSSGNPYKISDVNDWKELMSSSGDWGKSFEMISDVNLAGVTVTPVGNSTIKFRGVFDGNNHIISNLVINKPNSDNVGLFGYVEEGEIKNLGLKNIFIKGHYSTGGLAGQGVRSNIKDCYSEGSVSGGGLLGTNAGSIINCYSTCSGHSGLVWWNYGIIFNSYASGNVKTGGLVGENEGVIRRCYATGDIDGGMYSWASGGLVATNNGVILDSYSTGDITGGIIYAGGLVGENDDQSYSINFISNCYSTGDVDTSACCFFGGLIGLNASSGKISNCFWDIDAQSHGTTESICNQQGNGIITNVAGLSTEQMQQKAVYTTAPADWDFINIWGIGENQTYPYLRKYPASDINQDKRTDYVDLAALAENWLSKD